MKIKHLIAILAIAVFALTSRAQSTNGVWGDLGGLAQDIGLSPNPTNWAGSTFIGAKTSGGETAFGVVAVENVTKNAGVIFGFDTLFGGGKVGSANIVSGGLTLQAPFHPLRFIGLTGWTSNLLATPYAIAMAGTPIRGTGSSDGGLASIVRTGVNLDVYQYKGFVFGMGADYGTRSGSGNYNGDWLDFVFTIRKGF